MQGPIPLERRVGDAVSSAELHSDTRSPRRLLDVFCGTTAPNASEALKAAWEVERLDVETDEEHVLTNSAALDDLCRRLRAGEFDWLFLAPPGGTFSVFMRLSPASSRSVTKPMGEAAAGP